MRVASMTLDRATLIKAAEICGSFVRPNGTHTFMYATACADLADHFRALAATVKDEPSERETWRREAEKTLDHLSGMLQKLAPDSEHRVNWREWITAVERYVCAREQRLVEALHFYEHHADYGHVAQIALREHGQPEPARSDQSLAASSESHLNGASSTFEAGAATYAGVPNAAPQDGIAPLKRVEGNGGPGRDETVIDPSGVGRDAAQAPAVEPFCWWAQVRTITDDHETVYSNDSERPAGNGWEPLYDKAALDQLALRHAKELDTLRAWLRKAERLLLLLLPCFESERDRQLHQRIERFLNDQ